MSSSLPLLQRTEANSSRSPSEAAPASRPTPVDPQRLAPDLGDSGPGLGPAAPPSAPAAVSAAAVAAALAMAIPPDVGLDMQRVLQRMLGNLADFLPTPASGLPTPAVIVLRLNDAPVGLGSFIGEEPRLPLGRVELKGGRIEAVVRFMLWGADVASLNDGMLALQGKLLAATQLLWGLGFLRFTALTSANPRFDTGMVAWGRTADYSLLYEHRYEATDAADSLIARIPIHADQETFNSPDRETSLVTDEMVRWDDRATAALVVRGPASLAGISALAFVATALPGGPVTLTRTFDGATGPAVNHIALGGFLAALADPVAPQRHARVAFDRFSDFLAQFSPTGGPVPLGDWNLDGRLDEYQGFALALDPPVHLAEVSERLEVTYANGTEPLDQVAVVYLRLG